MILTFQINYSTQFQHLTPSNISGALDSKILDTKALYGSSHSQNDPQITVLKTPDELAAYVAQQLKQEQE